MKNSEMTGTTSVLTTDDDGDVDLLDSGGRQPAFTGSQEGN